MSRPPNLCSSLLFSPSSLSCFQVPFSSALGSGKWLAFAFSVRFAAIPSMIPRLTGIGLHVAQGVFFPHLHRHVARRPRAASFTYGYPPFFFYIYVVFPCGVSFTLSKLHY